MGTPLMKTSCPAEADYIVRLLTVICADFLLLLLSLYETIRPLGLGRCWEKDPEEEIFSYRRRRTRFFPKDSMGL